MNATVTWEYKLLSFSFANGSEIQSSLNRYGREGWEASGGVTALLGNGWTVLMKRPIGDQPDVEAILRNSGAG